MSKITFVVPVYNAEKYLHKCINSILAQSITDFELILVDDGSTDNSLMVCKSYQRKDSRIKVLKKQNGGVSSARNFGIEHSTGEYIFFVDSDDYLDKKILENILNHIKNEDICFFNYTDVIAPNKELNIYQKNLIYLKENPQNFMLFYNNQGKGIIKNNTLIDESIAVYCWRCIFKTSFIKNNGIQFDELLISGEDRIFLFESLLKTNNICFIEDEFGYYHLSNRTNSLTSMKNGDKYQSRLYQQIVNMDKAENYLCEKNEFLSRNDIKQIRLERAFKMRQMVIYNEFHHNKKNAVENIKKYKKDDLFKYAFSLESFVYLVKYKKNLRELIKMILLKCHFYSILLKII